MQSQLTALPQEICEINTAVGLCTVYHPDLDETDQTAELAKQIFVEAFSTTYQDYHQKSGTSEPIEQWFRLKEGLTLITWLENTFDEEWEEARSGKKIIVYLKRQGTDSLDEKGLIGWLSHTPVSENGDVYLSQFSIEADSRNHQVATTLFKKRMKELFPEASTLKLIVRRINVIARSLYEKVGFTLDEKIDPKVYGDSYDDRYIGYRFSVDHRNSDDSFK